MNNIINMYQIFTRLFANANETNTKFGTLKENGCTKFNDISAEALKALRHFGTTHVWYTGVIRHASCTQYEKNGLKSDNSRVVKGRAGSPYAIKDYYDVCPDFAENVNKRMEEFEQLILRTHNSGLKCIIDFVPNHVSREYKSEKLPADAVDLGAGDNSDWAFSPLNNFYYLPHQELHLPELNAEQFPTVAGALPYSEFPARATGNDVFSAYPSAHDWYETIKLNYGVDYAQGKRKDFPQELPNTWHRMYEILRFWTLKGVDGFRCDMAEMVPVEFWGWVIPRIKELNPNLLFIAEVYNPQEYRNYIHNGKFDYLYDKVGLYDVLRGIIEGNASARHITDCWKMNDDIQQYMLRFLENHDEQRVASRFFAGDANTARAAMTLIATFGKGPMMLYFGQEIGERGMDCEGFSGIDGRTTIFDYWSLKQYNRWVNGGKFDGGKLNEEQKDLRFFYRSLQRFRQKYEAISEGLFYDLMWQNESNLDANKIYAFFRYTNKQKLLIVINFDKQNTHTFRLNIGEHALAAIGVPVKETLVLHEVFEAHFTDSFSLHEVLEVGLPLSILPNSALIFTIETA
ncbi:MAG: alpha-amylase family protein [Bacteroidales bacterium]|jgi:glycosidase|nr:alpha-amylase family protein [Bacteroidales bacterium]